MESERPTVLLVDDEPFNLDYLAQELEELDLEILTASDGQEALELIADSTPDMIFLDIMMPRLDGFGVLERLKAAPDWRDIPVVIISAASDMDNITRGIELGAEDFLPKPFNPVILQARLKAGLEKKRLRDIAQRYLQSLERELEIGREIQADFLPAEIPQPPGWQIEAIFQAAREVAGDFYDVFWITENQLAFILGDVTDKGVGAALYMALIRTLLRAGVLINDGQGYAAQERLCKAVQLVNHYICTIHDSKMYATLFFGTLDTSSGELNYVNAGHDPPYLMERGKIIDQLNPTGPAAGILDEAQFTMESRTLAPGACLVLYSDGVPDALNIDGEMLTQERWRGLLEGIEARGAAGVAVLRTQIFDFIGEAAQYDDISLLKLQREGE
jgi:serine phosphatase RsbU (regulator of sigma subunit)